MFAYESPAFSQILFGAGEFEVVYIDCEEELKVFVIVSTTPFRDWYETCFLKVLVAVAFPVCPRIYVSVKGQIEGADGVLDSVEVFWPDFIREADVGGSTTEF